MLSYLQLMNFKSFSEITLDLRTAYGEPKRVAYIYGENGSGKSNLMSSMLFLVQTLNTLENQLSSKEISDINNSLPVSINEKIKVHLLQQLIRTNFSSLSDLIDDYKMLGNEQPMSLKFGFRLKGADGSYFIEFSEHGIINEELRYQINEREGILFSLSKNLINLSPTVFSDNSYKKELYENIEKFWGKHTFMAILFNEINTKNSDYIKARLNKSIFEVIRWLSKLSLWCKQCESETARISIPFKFMRQLEKGTVKDQNSKELKLCETALNTFFTQLYSDIKSVYYVFTPIENKSSYELYFKKLIDGNLIDVPVSQESTGTRKLLDLFPMLFAVVSGSSVFIDEIDSGVHDLMMRNLLELLNDSFNGQLIATTHNTLLMENLPPEAIYIIHVDANGKKTIDCIADYKKRTQKANNIRNKYLRGDYDGIPFSGYFDFQEIVEDVLENIEPSDKDGDE